MKSKLETFNLPKCLLRSECREHSGSSGRNTRLSLIVTDRDDQGQRGSMLLFMENNV